MSQKMLSEGVTWVDRGLGEGTLPCNVGEDRKLKPKAVSPCSLPLPHHSSRS